MSDALGGFPRRGFYYASTKAGQKDGGERGIRTLGTPFGHSHDFQSCPFGHSGISPQNVNTKDIRKTYGGQGETMTTSENPAEHKSGFVAVAGRPNVGKSTLVNRIMRTELSIVTAKAQTTRNRITAIHTLSDAQMVLQDTPGIHEAKTPLNRSLVGAAVKTLEESDVILVVVLPAAGIHYDDRRIIELTEASHKPCILAINKIDTVERPYILPVIEAYSKAHDFDEIFPICALTGEGVDELETALVRLLPPGPPLFPEDEVSDLPTRFFIAEMVREQVTNMTGEEIPYKTTVVVESFKESNGHVLIHADIHVERDSQKKILVGKQGQMIKKIGIAAREKIEAFLELKVRLELFVKVTPNWTRDERKLREFGY
jgi:GTPase